MEFNTHTLIQHIKRYACGMPPTEEIPSLQNVLDKSRHSFQNAATSKEKKIQKWKFAFISSNICSVGK